MFIRHFKISSFSSNLAATALLQITHGKNRNLLQTGTERVMHVNFAWFYRLYPPRTEHWTLDANSWENDGNTFLSANLANAVLNVVILQFVYEYSLCRSLQRCPVVCVLFKNLMGRHASFSWPSNASRHKVFKYCQTVFKFKGGADEHKVPAQIFVFKLGRHSSCSYQTSWLFLKLTGEHFGQSRSQALSLFFLPFRWGEVCVTGSNATSSNQGLSSRTREANQTEPKIKVAFWCVI